MIRGQRTFSEWDERDVGQKVYVVLFHRQWKVSPFTVGPSREGKIWRHDSLFLILFSLKIPGAFI